MRWQKYTPARLLHETHRATDINYALILLLRWRSDYKMNKEKEREGKERARRRRGREKKGKGKKTMD